MILHILFGQRKDYEGEPEALECWDENCIDENPGGFEEACEKRIKACGGPSMFSSTRVVRVDVDSDMLNRLVNPKTPIIAGTVL